MNETAVNKTVKVAVWVLVVDAILTVLSVAFQRPELLNPQIIGALNILNIVLVAGKNLMDPNVKNF